MLHVVVVVVIVDIVPVVVVLCLPRQRQLFVHQSVNRTLGRGSYTVGTFPPERLLTLPRHCNPFSVVCLSRGSRKISRLTSRSFPLFLLRLLFPSLPSLTHPRESLGEPNRESQIVYSGIPSLDGYKGQVSRPRYPGRVSTSNWAKWRTQTCQYLLD